MTRFIQSSRMFSNIMNGHSQVLPCFLEGTVCKGFGRGSKELGTPTANFDNEVINNLPAELDCGIYYGLANVNSGQVYKAVMSIGWNPYYKNDKKSVEIHILHNFECDFYGANLKVAILGHIRPERDFQSLEELINEIKNDIRISEEKLDLNEHSKYITHPFFQSHLSGDK